MQTSPSVLLRGARHPRLSYAPPSAYSLGDEAIELARRAGLVLDPQQQDAIHLMLAVRPDGKWACFEYAEIEPRQNGKGALLETRSLAGLFLFGEKMILWSAHEFKTAMEGFLRLGGLINHLEYEGIVEPGSVKTTNANGEEGYTIRATGQRLKFIARSKSSGRGFSGDCNLIDEAFAFTPVQQAALQPTMNARPNPQMIYTSSPPLDGGTGAPLFALRDRAIQGKDDSLGFRDWGVAGDLDHLDGINLDDRELWAQANPALGDRISEEMISRNRRSMSATAFAREILGIWPRQVTAGGIIDTARWAVLVDRESKRDGDIALGVDIAPQREYAAIALFGVRSGDGLGHIQLVDYRQGTQWIVPRLVELCEALDPLAIGMNRATVTSLRPELSYVGINSPSKILDLVRGDVMTVAGTEMAAACGQVIDTVRQGGIRHHGQRPLDAAVSGARTRDVGDAIAWSRKVADTDISPLVAVTVARWTYLARIDVVDAVPPVPATVHSSPEGTHTASMWRPTQRLAL